MELTLRLFGGVGGNVRVPMREDDTDSFDGDHTIDEFRLEVERNSAGCCVDSSTSVENGCLHCFEKVLSALEVGATLVDPLRAGNGSMEADE